MKARVSVVLLCYNRPEMLRLALQSLAAQTWPGLEIIIVNNRSAFSDEIADMVRAYPGFRLIAVPFNSGFTGGMNRGIAEATGEYIYLTEEDIVLEPECIERLATAFSSDPSLSLGCPLMIDRESGRIRSAGGWFQLEPIYRQADYGAGEETTSFRTPRDVSYIAGNMIFARTALLRDLGSFRDDMFIYYDDIDLCARALRAGKRISVLPSARIWNLDPPSDRSALPMLEYHKIKNLFLVYLLHGSATVLPEFFLRYGIVAWLRSPLSSVGRLRAKAIGWTALHLPRLVRDRIRSGGRRPGALRRLLREGV